MLIRFYIEKFNFDLTFHAYGLRPGVAMILKKNELFCEFRIQMNRIGKLGRLGYAACNTQMSSFYQLS